MLSVVTKIRRILAGVRKLDKKLPNSYCKLSLLAVVIVYLACGFFLGVHYGQWSYEPKIEYVTTTQFKPVEIVRVVETSKVIEKIVEKIVEKPIKVERLVIKEVPIEVEIYVPLSDWVSVEELEAFLAQDDTDQHIILVAGSDGVVRFDGQCEDYALQLRDRSMVAGKYLSVIALHPVEYYKWYGKRSQSYHAINMARIGNELWYIEPQTDKHWLALHLD